MDGEGQKCGVEVVEDGGWSVVTLTHPATATSSTGTSTVLPPRPPTTTTGAKRYVLAVPHFIDTSASIVLHIPACISLPICHTLMRVHADTYQADSSLTESIICFGTSPAFSIYISYAGCNGNVGKCNLPFPLCYNEYTVYALA